MRLISSQSPCQELLSYHPNFPFDLGSHSCHISLASASSNKGKTSSSGLVMIRRHSWRYLNIISYTNNTNTAQIYTATLEGYVPVDIKIFNAFLDFCYIAQKSVLTETDLGTLDTTLQQFHHYHEIFQDAGVQPDSFLLPRQHALIHYHHHIENFSTPNGLCSSITKSKHITAVKKPWRRSNHYNALQKMLMINTQNNKLAATWTNFLSCGMLDGTCLNETLCVLSSNPDNTDTGTDTDTNTNTNSDSDGDGLDLDADDHNDDLCGPVDGPPILSEVVLASKKGMPCVHTVLTYIDSSIVTKYPTTLSARQTYWPTEPWGSCLQVPFLPSKPSGNPSAGHSIYPLDDCRHHMPLSLPFCACNILCPQQPIRDWWLVWWDNPFRSPMEVRGHRWPSSRLYPSWQWLRWTRGKRLRDHKSASVLLV